MGGQLDPRSLAGPAGIVPTGLIRSGSLAGRDYGAGFAVSVLNECINVNMPGVSGVYAPVYSASGKGALQFLAVGNYDATARTQSVRVTIDANRVFDISTGHFNTNYATALVGAILPAGSSVWVPLFEPLLFEKSLLIEHASSVTDAGSARIAYRVIPR